MDLLGPEAMLWPPDGPDGGRFSEYFAFSSASSIYGGTDQIQRNVISERVLGLPREAGPGQDHALSGSPRKPAGQRREGGAMSFVTTDEQKALRQTVRSFLESKSDEAAVRAAMVSELGFDRGLWDQLAGQLGLAGLAIPEEYGGSGSSMSDLAVVMSELGRFLVCSPYLASAVLAANALLESGDKQACLAYLPRLASGELLAALAVNEQTSELAPGADRTSAEPSGNDWKITGEKSFVVSGLAADILVVSATTASGPSLFVIDAAHDSVQRTALSVMDLTRHQARIAVRANPGHPPRRGRRGSQSACPGRRKRPSWRSPASSPALPSAAWR